MAKKLVVVESPAKARTISNFLGKDFQVKASMGHIRDLPSSKMGVDIENNYEPTYSISKGKRKVVTDLNKSLEKADELWIATDEDREGEAIGWHLAKALKVNKKPIQRIVFHEITKSAIEAAVKNPRQINDNLVDAQQARRILDRLVGYTLSPLLWTKIRYGLSAGRVQSVAVRLIVDREREIEAFVAEEYWSIQAVLQPGKKDTFTAELAKINDKKAKVGNGNEAAEIVEKANTHDFKIESIEIKEQKRSPKPPFTTSTLQQEAARKLRFSVSKTMMLAQQLYEGLEKLSERGGLITYMRTDSVQMAAGAKAQARQIAQKQFGEEFAPDSNRGYKSKKGAQEAHEAIRPVDFSFTPSQAKKHLSNDQFKLYNLIWQRALASQMADAVFEKMKIIINSSGKSDQYTWYANGQKEVFKGFLTLYSEGTDNGNADDEDKELPDIKKTDSLSCQEIIPTQHFTKPPARFTEASLVKTLEKEGIGRPSTYAPTITTIIKRGYIVKDKQYLLPTDTAFVVNDMLVQHFPNIVDVKFTARMEEDLDDIAEGKKDWLPIIDQFYQPFAAKIDEKKKTLGKQTVLKELDETCPDCGGKLVVKLGRYGKFKSCSNFPDCKFAEPLEAEEIEVPEEKKVCAKCGGEMQVKKGRFGPFLGCSKYPDCKNIVPLSKELDVNCPECDTGKMTEKRTRKGKIFYGCGNYPKCKFALWEKPTGSKCELCGSLRTLKNNGKEHCSNKECADY